MKFTVIRFYEDDPDFVGDTVNTQLLNADGIVIMEGDYYHDKIEYQIDGFFRCLEYMGIKYSKTEEKRNENYDDDEE